MKRFISILSVFTLLFGLFSFASSAAVKEYVYTDISENTHSTLYGGKTAAVFGRPDCANTASTLENISSSADSFKDIQLLFCDIDENEKNTVAQFSEGFSDDIFFCYGDYNMDMWNIYWDTNGFTDALYLPVTVLFDESGRVIKTLSGAKTANEILDALGLEAVIDLNKEPFSMYFNRTADYDFALKVASLVNEERAKAGLSPLSVNKSLFETAMLRSAEISVYYDHTRPDDTLCFTAFPDNAGAMGENIAIGYDSPESVMTAWMNSEGHRANILTPHYTSIGVGCLVAENGYIYWTQVFSDTGSEKGTPTGKRTEKYKVSALSKFVEIELLTGQFDYSESDIGKTLPIKVICTDPAVGLPVEVLPESFTFSSSDPTVASVTQEGKVTILKCGKTVISATARDNLTKVFTLEIYVENTSSPHTHDYKFTDFLTDEFANRYGMEYTCTVCGATEKKMAIFGDVDGDTAITASDARFTLRASVGLEIIEEDTLTFIAADADKNTELTAADARLILRASVGLEALN